MPIVLEVKNLSKNYGSVAAVKDVSFNVSENEIFALIGPNGAGKSTTIRMIATILKPTSGKASVLEHDIVKDADRVREAISYLPEEAGAYKNLTGRQYLKFMADLYADDKKKSKEFVLLGEELSGLGKRLTDKIGTYSKGMTRKILLARTLMIHPKLAILDEPTSGLDMINALEIRKIIRQFSRQGMAVLLSSHNMLEIEFLSDRVAIIDKGEIREIGTSEELKTKYDSRNLEEVFLRVAKPSF
ncbi:MAG: ABC transporter ATP-binding protein [Patescibacteria group bacterium]|jgi:ABC-2 type transport system ATP-binding protein